MKKFLKENTRKLFALGVVIAMFIVIVSLTVLVISIKKDNKTLVAKFEPYEKNIHVSVEMTNKMFTEAQDIDFVAIGMEHRVDSHFNKLRDKLLEQGITVTFFKGLSGKTLNMADYNLAPRYLNFFKNNIAEREAGKTKTDYRGHFGATVSHLEVIKKIERMTVVLEDDADPVPNFREKLQQTIADATRHDPDWELLVLGCSANYKDHFYHKLNDREAVYPGGIVKYHYWIGGWALVYRDKKTAQKIAKFFDPITWHIDLSLAEQARLGNLKAYGRIPTIVNHPGYLRISSFDYVQIGDVSLIRTDTNK